MMDKKRERGVIPIKKKRRDEYLIVLLVASNA